MSSRHTTPTDSQKPIQSLNDRQLYGSAKYYYHLYRCAEENLHTEIKNILVGQCIGATRLNRLKQARDEAYETMLQFAKEITRRIRDTHSLADNQDDDDRFLDYLRERRRRIEKAGKKVNFKL